MSPLDWYYLKLFGIIFGFAGLMLAWFAFESRRLDRLDAEADRRSEKLQRMTGRVGGPQR